VTAGQWDITKSHVMFCIPIYEALFTVNKGTGNAKRTMSHKYHTLHKRFIPKANTKHQNQCIRMQMATGHLVRHDRHLHATVSGMTRQT
jgi:hypothetical protein